MPQELISKDVQCLEYNEYPLGNHFKTSKMLYQWTFKYQEKIYNLKFYVSWASCYRELLLNEKVLLQKQKYFGKISMWFKFGYDIYSIEQFYGTFILRINTIPFNQLIGVLPMNSFIIQNESNNNQSLVDYNDNDIKKDKSKWNWNLMNYINRTITVKSKDNEEKLL